MATQWQQQAPQPPHYQGAAQFPHQPQQYQQHTRYQQPGPYTQPGQYQQPGQSAQAQHYQPNQQYRPHQQGYSGYQQQYASQQYHPQQHLPPQQNQRSYGAYQQPYQQQASSTYSQTPAQIAAPQACYNCASPDHFAQDCPEPKREVPAGALDPVRFANPLKRARPSNTIVTRYQGAPHSQNYAPSQGYGPTPSPQGPSGYPQFQTQQIPVTPTSAQSPAQQQYVQQQWQQYYQYQQAYQQGSYNQQGGHFHQQQYQTSTTPTKAYPNGSQRPNQASPQTSQNGQIPQMHQSQYSQTQQTQQPVASAMPIQQTQQSTSTVSDSAAIMPKHRESPLPSDSALTGTHNSANTDVETEEDDLTSLDIPSLPSSPSLNGTKLYCPINLLCMPLPANFVVADTLYPIEPPAPDMNGRCQSKYLRDANLETLKNNIRYSKYWKDHKDDPVFSELPIDDNTVTLEELLIKVKERHVNGELSEDTLRGSRSLSRSVSARHNSGDFRDDLATLERNLARLKAEMERKEMLARGKHASPLQPIPSQQQADGHVIVKKEEGKSPQSSEKAPMSAQETEDMLASLGVTGPPKPIMRPYHAASHGSPHDNTKPQSKSPSNGEVSYLSQDHQRYGSPQGYGPKAPLPPPYRQQPFVGDTNGSTVSAPSLYTKSNGHNADRMEYGNGHFDHAVDAQFPSPIELHSETSGSRKRSFTRRNSVSDEEETPARRQEDDITPKHKRRAPKVQEAYSRRW